MYAEHGGVRRVPGRITGRTVYDNEGAATADAAEGLPDRVRYDAKAYMVDVANKKAWTVLASNKEPDGGRPTDDVTIKYASIGDSCEIEVSDGGQRLIVCTEKIVFKTCTEAAARASIPAGSIIVVEQ